MKNLHAYLILVFLFISCSSEDAEIVDPLSSDNDILSFEIEGIETEIVNTRLLVYAFPSRDFRDFMFLPSIEISPGATISPEPTLENYNEVNSNAFVVRAENGSSKEYRSETIVRDGIVEINVIYKNINNLDNEGNPIATKFFGSIDETNKVIEFNFKLDILDEPGSTIQLDMILRGDVIVTPEQDTVVNLTLDELTANINEEDIVYTVNFTDFVGN